MPAGGRDVMATAMATEWRHGMDERWREADGPVARETIVLALADAPAPALEVLVQ